MWTSRSASCGFHDRNDAVGGQVAIAPLPYWCLMTVIAAIVVLICAVTYRWIERPAMRGRAMIASPHWQPEPAVSPSRSGQ